MKKLLIICGPTATGKTGLAAFLAKKFDGELISADSRQVYQGMDIMTGKDRPVGVKIHLIDVVKPNQDFSAAQFYRLARKIINRLWTEKILPFVVGGTGFYIKTLLGEVETKKIPPNTKIRTGMGDWNKEKLFDYLQNLDPLKAASLNKSDRNNPRRLIRAIEIAVWRQENPLSSRPQKSKIIFDSLLIGLKTDFKQLYQRIDERTEQMLKQGAQKELTNLIKQGYSWHNSVLKATIGYREWEDYFQKKVSKEQVIKKWKFNEHAYARRQMTWFKKEKRIHWFDIAYENWQDEVEQLVKKWYHKKDAAKD